jgi:hypothetical protein
MSLPDISRIPLNTMLADLDESLKGLMQSELARHGFELVQIVFDAPTKEWASTLSAPTLNLFLYDIRETRSIAREIGRSARTTTAVASSSAALARRRRLRGHGLDARRRGRAPHALAGARDPVRVPGAAARRADGLAAQRPQRFPLHTRIAQERSDGGSNFWTAVGGQYKASLDYVVTLSCEPGSLIERGPEVRTATLRTQRAGGEATREEAHRFGGSVRDSNGDPVVGAWVALPDSGRFAATDARGFFLIEHVPLGSQRLVARGPDGAEQEAQIEVPGSRVDIVLGAHEPAPKRTAKG